VWVFFLLRIKDEEGEVETKLVSKSKIACIVIFYIVNMTYRVGLAVEQISDRPLTDPNYADNLFISLMYGTSMVVLLFVIIYILTLYCALCAQERPLLWRNSLFFSISFFFFIIVFGIFMVGGFDVFEYSASRVMYTYTFMNFFSFYLQFMYLPSQPVEELEEERIKQEKRNEELENFAILDDEDVSIDLEKDYDYML
jgi:hypothetical protein